MHHPSQLADSVDPACNGSSQLHMKFSSISITEYDSDGGQESSYQATPPLGRYADSLGSSALSLGPPGSPLDGRRKLLLVYIHGFMGAEDSFRRFPAHVHNLVADALAESHVVYSKVYPRYKSRRSMEIARDEFSEWIMPHESHQTDVILLGHSLGGILAAEVALAEAEGADRLSDYRHRIIGIINFDVPFLGMHPSVVGTGLAALFHSKRKDESALQNETKSAYLESSSSLSSGLSLQESNETSPSWFEQAPDSNYDPPFSNDIHRLRRSQLDGAFHFLKKNSGHLVTAVKEYANSYLEFGGCLADYSGLRRRYALLKELEAIDDMEPKPNKRGRLQRRLRFVNYYTASSGFPKKPPSNSKGQLTPSNQPVSATDSLENLTKLPSPTIPIESFDSREKSLVELEPTPLDDYHAVVNVSSSDSSCDILSKQPAVDHEVVECNDNVLELLPPLPAIPPEPPALNLSLYKNKDMLKQARKEHERLTKLYERAKKEHDLTLNEREKLVQKLSKRNQNSLSSATLETGASENLNDPAIISDDHLKPTSVSPSGRSSDASSTPQLGENITSGNSSYPVSETASVSVKTQKDRVFCALPRTSDRLWVRIFMPDIDQVVAHQSIFKPNGLYYEWLVNDTAARIEKWVQDDSTRRVIWEHFGET